MSSSTSTIDNSLSELNLLNLNGTEKSEMVPMVLDGTETNSNNSLSLKRDAALSGWSFTWFHYDSDRVNAFVRILNKNGTKKYVFQEEVCPSSGKDHIQGSITFKKRIRKSALIKMFDKELKTNITWIKTRNEVAADAYCMKTESRKDGGQQWSFGLPVALEILKKEQLYKWQMKVADMVLTKPDERTINWVYDPEGNHGKTKLCKYLQGTYPNKVIGLTAGSCADVANNLKNAKDGGMDLNNHLTIIFHYARTAEHIAYKAIESCKDGYITNTKYESGTMVFNNPHVWVFANVFPELEKLTKDRWKLWKIDEFNDLAEHEIIEDNCEELLDRNIEKKTCCKVIFNE